MLLLFALLHALALGGDPTVETGLVAPWHPPRHPPAPAVVEQAARTAESRVGTPYVLGGRGSERRPGLDCQGLPFTSFGRATGTSWRRYPWDPSRTVASGMLGTPVPGLDGRRTAAVEPWRLRRGDVVYLLDTASNDDDPLWTDADGVSWWGWHMAIAVGDGLVVHADPVRGVVKEPLHALPYAAIFVTRPTADMPRWAADRGD